MHSLQNPQIDQEDALGADYDDRQGVFNGNGRASGSGARPAVVPESSGSGAAKALMIFFVVALIACAVWIGWRLMNRGGADAEDTLSLPTADASAVPMSGAPHEEPSAPDLAPISPQAVSGNGALPPAAAPSPAPAPAITPEPVAPVGPPSVAAVAPLSPPAESVSAVTAPASTPIPTAATAQLVEQLQAMNRRLEDLERRVGVMQSQAAISPNDARAPVPTRRRVASPPARPTVSTTVVAREPRAESSPTTIGAQLKAVLEGRAWLQLKSGETVTVAAGDDVAGVGTVRAIDAERGEVLFTNGAVLR